MSSAEMTQGNTHAPGEHPDLPPPATEIGVWGWIYHNLLSTKMNFFITVVTLYFLYLIVPPMLDWLFFNAVFEGASRDECRAIMIETGNRGAASSCSSTVFTRKPSAGGSTCRSS